MSSAMWLFDVATNMISSTETEKGGPLVDEFRETVLGGVIQSLRHQAQTVDTSKTHLLLA